MWAKVALRPRFKLATFDVTNTLLQFQCSAGETYAGVAKAHGIHCDPQRIEYAFRNLFKLQSATHPNYGRHTGITTQDWWKQLVSNSLSQSHPGLFTKSQLTAISDDLYQLYTTKKCYKVPKAVPEQLKILREHNVILGVISNYDERLEAVLAANGLKDFFHFVLSSYVEGVEKPDRRIFDLALSKASHLDISASEAVHIGDQVHLDYEGARNAGWSAYLISHDEEELIEKPPIDDMVVNVKNLSQYILKPLEK